MSETVQLKKVMVKVSADGTVASLALGEDYTVKNNETYDGIQLTFKAINVVYNGSPAQTYQPTATITFKEKETLTLTGGRFANNNYQPLRLVDSNDNTVIFRAEITL